MKQTGKPWWKTFLTPGWVLSAVLIILFSYFAFTTLAPWQLGKNERLEQRNEHIVEAFDQDPVPLDTRVNPDGSLPDGADWSRVVATGHYAQGAEVLLRLRSVDRVAAFQVLTPFELNDGRTVLVNRGWVPAKEASHVPPIEPAPTGEVTITGMLLADEGVHPTEPNIIEGHQMVYSVSPGQIGELTGTDPISPYIQLLGGSPGVINPIPLPQLETGNHLSYGLQWIAFGLLAPAGLIYFIVSETRERRRFREEQEELLLSDATTPSPTPAPTSAAAAPDASAAPAPAPARSRYGGGRRNPWATDRDEER
ncbi:hypothetical protein HMPREF3104_11045 [Corynebacterium sp. HMSC30G07]|uniref:SURF1 family cytochrome oxidase biogenesis protein n=1 Tax=Corynebacterium sp. HMSC30G07 TaxID=1581072 RepID=UPI0008A50368|nr:SURF1 family cytochrome oxidase biogenesis protein [Corynebacterium sp. HMSC30G07]OFT73939.1 hypothetical protein HMPREF3104_11045 [Corynebacterium sp. HMSC30G07]